MANGLAQGESLTRFEADLYSCDKPTGEGGRANLPSVPYTGRLAVAALLNLAWNARALAQGYSVLGLANGYYALCGGVQMAENLESEDVTDEDRLRIVDATVPFYVDGVAGLGLDEEEWFDGLAQVISHQTAPDRDTESSPLYRPLLASIARLLDIGDATLQTQAGYGLDALVWYSLRREPYEALVNQHLGHAAASSPQPCECGAMAIRAVRDARGLVSAWAAKHPNAPQYVVDYLWEATVGEAGWIPGRTI